VKNNRLDGVGDTLVLGKSGPALRKVDASTIEVLTPPLSGYTVLKVKTPVGANDLANKKWLQDQYALGDFSTFNTYVSNTSGTDTFTLPDTAVASLEATYVLIKTSSYQMINVLRIVPFTGQKISFNNNIIEQPGYIEIRAANFPVSLTVTAAGLWTVTSALEQSNDGFNNLNYTISARNSWVSKATIASSRTAKGCFTVNGFSYMAGGVSTPPTIQYNDITNAWATKTNLLTTSSNARSLAPTFALNGKGYVTSGFDNFTLNSQYTDFYDGWLAKAVGNIAYVSSGATLNGFGYKIAGNDGLGATNYPIHQYSDSTDAWVNKVSFGSARAKEGVGHNGYIYIANGFTQAGATLADVNQYNDVTNAFITKTDVPQSRYGNGLAALNGYIYSTCGNLNPGVVATNYEFNDLLNTWTTKTSATTAKSYVQGIALNGYLYSQAGGTTANEQFN